MIQDKQRLWKWSKRTLLAMAAVVLFCAALCFAPISIEVRQNDSVKAEGIKEGVELDRGAVKRDADANSTQDAELGEREIINAVCSLIDKGKFYAAGQLLKTSVSQSGDVNGAEVKVDEKQIRLAGQLKDIVSEWDKLQEKRMLQKEATYKEQLAGFERVKKGLSFDVNDANEVNEVNEPNIGPTAILAAVIRTNEFADANQKKVLLADPCVLAAIDTAKRKSAELEQKGKWLDAYLRYYSLLAALEPNNKSYSEHSEQIIEKAEIVGAFTDNPCETVGQRFNGVKRRIFERAVDELNIKYISKIDYREMSLKGVKRCRALGEVVGTLLSQTGQPGEPNIASLGASFKDFKADSNTIASLCSGLLAIEQDVNNWAQGASKDKFLSVFGRVLELNLEGAKLPEGVMIAEFAEASFATLDPYTVIVWPTNVADFEKIMTNEFSGIGIEITRQKGQLTVGSLLPDTPAYNSGLDAGDVIESVDGMPTKDMPLPCAVKYITGPSGTKVKLTIRHEGDQQAKELTITRAKITVPTIRGWERTEQGNWRYMVDDNDKIGYVRVTSFSEKTAADLEEALDSLEAKGMKGLILDLRYNTGGFFDSAVAVSDLFLDDGLIVITRPRYGLPSYAAAHKRGTHPNYPLVVLINSGSASASEIVAGALCDPSHNRATLVGERTHGKGVVQGVTDYPGDGAQLKYTMAYYHLPSGQRVKSREEAEKDKTNEWGIAPNVLVELRSDEIRKAFDVQRDNDVLVKAGHDQAASPVKKHTLGEMIGVDPQLETGILVIKSKLIREETRTAKSQTSTSKS